MKFGTSGIRFALTLCLLVGCSSSSSTGGGGGTSGLGGVSGLGGGTGAGTGGAAGSGVDPAASFAGTWTFETGTLQPKCSVAVNNLDLTGDALTITRLDPTHIHVASAGGIACNADFTISGTTATVEAGQTCTANIKGIGVTVNVTSWSVGLSGSTLSTTLMGTVNGAVTCTPLGTGMLVRAG